MTNVEEKNPIVIGTIEDESKVITSNTQAVSNSIYLPDISVSDIINDPKMTSIIQQNLEKWNQEWQELKQFLETGLINLFSENNRTVEQINKIFAQVIDLDEAKNEIKKVLAEYEKFDNDSVTWAIRKIDNELTEIKPMLGNMRNSIEWTVGFFKSLFAWWKNKLFTSTIQWISGRVDSISSVFESYGNALSKNEDVLRSLLPAIWLRIKKIDAMNSALEIIVSQTDDINAKKILNDLSAELTNISWLQKESMARLMMLSMMNWNAKLVLQATEVETITTLQPLIIENVVWWTQKKAYELRDKAREWLKQMRESSKANIDSIMKSEQSEKEKQVQRLQEITSNIDRVLDRSASHRKVMENANKLLSDYMPTYKEKINKLENGIVDMGKNSQDFVVASQKLIDQMSVEKAELEKRKLK